MNKSKKWYDYLWIFSTLYLILGFVNILFAWIGLMCFFIPLGISIIKGNKAYCNRYCGRGQLFHVLGNKLKLSRQKEIPAFIKSNWFRYGFLTFFMLMFGNMLFSTYLVFSNSQSLKEVVKVLWSINVPWSFAHKITIVDPWISQFAFGFYGVMLTSTLLGVFTMILFKPRSWCVYCPMGTMTQGICKLKSKR